MTKFSANLGFLWADKPLLDRIDAAAAAGFKAVEFHWPYDIPADAVREACRRAGVLPLALNTPTGDASAGEFGLAAVDGRQAVFQAGFDQAIAYARAVGMSAIHVMAGVVSPSGKERGAEVLVENLKLTARKAPELTLLLEPINQRDRPNYFYSTIAEAAAILDRVAAPNLKIMFDVYHVGVSEGDVLTRLQRYLPSIGHVQIAAVPSRAEPDEGEIAYRAIFDALDSLGYAGWIGCEYKPRARTDDGLAWVKTLGVAL